MSRLHINIAQKLFGNIETRPSRRKDRYMDATRVNANNPHGIATKLLYNISEANGYFCENWITYNNV